MEAKWQGRAVDLIRSNEGTLNCFQACFAMAANALTGSSISLEEAKILTGFVPGRETWPNQGLLSFSELGVTAKSIECLDAEAFAKNPKEVIRKMFPDDEVYKYILSITDLDREARLVSLCLQNPMIDIVNRTPQIFDVREAISEGGLVIAVVDYGELHDLDEFEGHMVLVTGVSDSTVEIFDPGPPGAVAWEVSTSKFDAALHAPSSSSGQVIQLFRSK